MTSILVTPGEPAGIGPELALGVCAGRPDTILVADPGLLERRRAVAGASPKIQVIDRLDTPREKNAVRCWPVPLAERERPGRLDPANAAYVLECLAQAADFCRHGEAAALVTGPVHKSVINDAGHAFTGHTEFLARRARAGRVVMMLAAGSLRVALATTHLPLREVADAITQENLTRTLEILHRDLGEKFRIKNPVIAVLGLNPHAGEGGHLGREEIEIIEPVLAWLRESGMDLRGPLPADTAFVPTQLEAFDAVCAMYHDQGLPVLKHAGFGHSVNVTLGLPFIRTSVDHGTALDLAGTGRADPGSFEAAIALACHLAKTQE